MQYFLWLKAWHIIAVVTWFAAIFYLPRLFVYHAMSNDKISHDRFIIMERKLYRGIMMPSMVVVWALGLWMTYLNWAYYKIQGWLHVKITLVVLLTIYHFMCDYYRKKLIENPHYKPHIYWRFFNEVPTVILLAVVILVVVKPF